MPLVYSYISAPALIVRIAIGDINFRPVLRSPWPRPVAERGRIRLQPPPSARLCALCAYVHGQTFPHSEEQGSCAQIDEAGLRGGPVFYLLAVAATCALA